MKEIFDPCEASLSVNMCMRNGPCKDQIIADSLVFSEVMRTKSICGSDDVFTMVAKMSKMPSFQETTNNPATAASICKLCEHWGLRWHGKPIEKHNWWNIQQIMPFCQDGALQSAIGDIKALFPAIDTLTKLAKICKATSTFIKGSFINEEFQEKWAPALALVWALHWFYYSLSFEDVDDTMKINDGWLVGTKASEVGMMQSYFRKLQGLDYVWKHYRVSAGYSREVDKTLWGKFSSMPAFVNNFAAPDFYKKDADAVFANGQKGICHWTSVKFTEFCTKLPNSTAVALAELLWGIFTTEFDIQFMAHAELHHDGGHADFDSLSKLLRGPDADSLTTAFKKYTAASAAQAVSIPDDDGSGQPLASQACLQLDSSMDGTDPEVTAEKKERQELFASVLANKNKVVRFHCLPALASGPLGSFMTPAALTKVLANCPFHSGEVKKLGKKEKAKNKAWLLSADLFPGMMAQGLKDFRLPAKYFQETPVPESLKALWRFVLSARKPDDAIIIFDGRFSQVRLFFLNELNKLGQQFNIEMWIIYDSPDSDIRYPKRHLAFSNCNREVILVYRPVHKKATKANARHEFNALGETSTHCLTYSKVTLRTLGEYPKLTPQDKKKMMGSELDIPLAYREEDNSFAEDGVPFSWCESKSVDWFVSFLRDMEVDALFDTTAGSAAAAIAAYYVGVQYDGLCCNPLHQAWCEQLMHQGMFAVVAGGGAGATKEHTQKVLHFFGPSVDEGMRMLKAADVAKAEEPVAAPVEESSAAEEEDSDHDSQGF